MSPEVTVPLQRVKAVYEAAGRTDPLGAVAPHANASGRQWSVSELYETGRKEMDRVFAQLAGWKLDVRRKRALDFGCGVGRFSQALCERFDEVVGVDIAASMIAEARRHNRFGPRCRYLENARPDLSLLESASFDFIYSHITLQHIPPPYAAGYIQELFRLLRRGGVAWFQVPSVYLPHERAPFGWRRTLQQLRWRARVTWKAVRGKPIFDMFWIPRQEVEAIIQDAGGELLQTETRRSGNDRWIFVTYCARRA